MTLGVVQPDRGPLFQSPIIVVGHPRSGTSLVAGALARCGAWVGPHHTSSDNPGGFYENAMLSHKLRAALQGASYDPLGVASLPPPGWPRTRGERSSFRLTRAEVEWHITQDGYAGEGPWAWKQCKLLLVWQVVQDWWPDAKWVFVSRPIDDIVESCLNTPFMAQHTRAMRHELRRDFWVKSIHAYWTRATAMCLQCDAVDVWSPSVVAGNLDELRGVVEHCGLAWDEDAVRSWVEPRWWHGAAA